MANLTPAKNPAAIALGRLGGQATTARKVAAARRNLRKAAAARKNGQKGGWPKGKRRKRDVEKARRQYVAEVISPLMSKLAKGTPRKGKR